MAATKSAATRTPKKKALKDPAPKLSPEALLAVPTNFCREILGVQLYDWQAEVISWYSDNEARVKGSVAAPNGSGKSERVIACLALWWLCMAPKARVVITSKDSRQLDEQLWPALEQHKAKFKGFIWNDRYIESPTGGKIIGFTTDDPGRAEGWHKQPDGPLLLIADEAKSIQEAIFTAFDRCTFNGMLYISSTGLMQGRFYESHTSRSDQYKTKRVGLVDCPHIPRERIDDIISSYGEDHPFTRSTLYSEFMSQDAESAFFFSLAALDKNVQNPPTRKAGDRVAFCDFAGGGDENVLALREGNKITIEKAWRETNEMAAIGEFIREFKRLGLRQEEIYGDNCGAGKPMINRFRELGWHINPFNGGDTAYNDVEYANRNAEVWEMASQSVTRGEFILPNDNVLTAQMTSRKRMVDSKGRFKCESKDDMRKRGVKSPDRADAVTAVMSLRELRVITPGGNKVPSWTDFLSERTYDETVGGGVLAGCDAGD